MRLLYSIVLLIVVIWIRVKSVRWPTESDQGDGLRRFAQRLVICRPAQTSRHANNLLAGGLEVAPPPHEPAWRCEAAIKRRPLLEANVRNTALNSRRVSGACDVLSRGFSDSASLLP